MTTSLGEPETLGELVAQISRMVQGSLVEPRTWLNASMDVSTTAMSITEQREEITVGSVLCVDLEQMRVKDVAGATVTVERGYTGLPAVTHASGTLVQIGWSDPYSSIASAMVEEVRSWPEELFQERTVSVGLTDASFTNVVLVDFIEVLGATMTDARGTRPVRAEVLPAAPASVYAGGSAVRSLNYRDTGTLVLTYASSFGDGDLAAATLATDIEDLSIPPRLLDIVKFGVGWRLLAGGETQRLAITSQGEPRRAEEVRALQRMQGGMANKNLRDERIEEEIARLRKLYPVRF